MFVSTEAELGYRDAIHQITRSLQRRHKTLEDDCKEAVADKQQELHVRMQELEHILQILESLHR